MEMSTEVEMEKEKQYKTFSEEINFFINSEINSLKNTKSTKFYLDDFEHLMAELISSHLEFSLDEDVINCGKYIFVMERFLNWYNDPENGYYYDVDGGLGQLFKDAVNYAVRNITRKVIAILIKKGFPYDRSKPYLIDNKFINDFKEELDKISIIENMF